MNMKIINQKTFATILAVGFFAVPVFVWAQVGIPCGDIAAGQKMCGFDDLIILINNIIKFLMFKVAVPLAALGFMFMGAKLVINQNKEGAWTEAKAGLGYIATGFFMMLGAYILIKTIPFALLSNDQVAFMQFMFQ